MAKPSVVDQRFDFRGGRNTAISPDLLNPNELVDCTNARLSATYGGFSKRSGSQRIHQTAFPAAIRGVTQWDVPSGKQVVVISNGDLYWRNGFDFNTGFTLATSPGVARSTAGQGATKGWTDPDGVNDGINSVTRTSGGASTNAAGDRLILKFGDPAIDSNLPAADDRYTLSFNLECENNTVAASGTSQVQLEYSTNDGGLWTTLTPVYQIGAGPGDGPSDAFTVTVMIDIPGIKLWIRPILTLFANGAFGISENIIARVRCFPNVTGTYLTDNFAGTWNSGGSKFSLTEPTIFAPFRASASGAPLVLYMASGGHYFSWDGVTLAQLDPINSAPLTTGIISYHTRMFAMSASKVTPGLLPKTIFWSRLGDATNFNTGTKVDGGSAVTDFLTGQQLVALEVIGSSLLMGTNDSVMRFTGHASDDIVIAQDTEGVSSEVGPVGLLALKRYENVAGMMTDRGPYVVTETYAEPSAEQLNPDWQALDSENLSKSSIEYNRARKEMLFAVPRSNDGGSPKTIFSQSVRLQSWQGPWIYPFSIECMCKYFDENGNPNVLAGSADGFVRLMDIGNLDDVLFDGTGGSNITMTVEIPVIHFGVPGQKKTLKWIILQGDLPTGSTLNVNVSFDGEAFQSVQVVPDGSGIKNYRVDLDSQGFRLRLQFVDNSAQPVTVNGFTLEGWNLIRTT